MPPKKQLYPFAFIISCISVVVVVFPSLPVTPITVLGHNSTHISISVVTSAPLSVSATNSFVVGKQLGERNIRSNPFNFDK